MKVNWLSGVGNSLGSFFSTGGAFFGAACPACVPAVGALFSAIGLGFLVNFTILKWLTIVLLAAGLIGLYVNFQKHGRKSFLILGFLASLVVFSSRYIVENNPALYVGAAALLVNSFFDYRHATCNKCRKIAKI